MIIQVPPNKTGSITTQTSPNLQRVPEHLVHLGHLRRHAQVDGPVADLDDEAALDVGVDLGDDLELLALPDVGRLGGALLELADSPGIEGLCNERG